MRKSDLIGFLLLAFVIGCRLAVPVADFYAVRCYPVVSAGLSLCASALTFSLEEVVVIGFVVAFVSVLVRAVRKKEGFLRWLGKTARVAMWLVVWLYMGWGNNYFRTPLYPRMGIQRASFEEEAFSRFLADYTEALNETAEAVAPRGPQAQKTQHAPQIHETQQPPQVQKAQHAPQIHETQQPPQVQKAQHAPQVHEIQQPLQVHQAQKFQHAPQPHQPHQAQDSHQSLEADIKAFYSAEVSCFGYAGLRPWQHVKRPLLNPLYSAVGVLGFMGPFLCESQLNLDLPEVEHPFTLAHELAHLTGVTSEAEANYWAYVYCRRSGDPAVRYSGHLALLPYVAASAASLLPEADCAAWTATLADQAKEDYTALRQYWEGRRMALIDKAQQWMMDRFLRTNGVSEGAKDYYGVIGMLMTMDACEKPSAESH